MVTVATEDMKSLMCTAIQAMDIQLYIHTITCDGEILVLISVKISLHDLTLLMIFFGVVYI